MATKWTPSQQLAMQLHGQDLLISAAAGSGKTATLTERIIRELIGSITTKDGRTLPPADISRMLIVTFTRAAAAELRSRLSAALSAAIAAHPDDRHLYRQLVALGSASICTIDSFYLQPVRANFERLGLPSSFRLADDGELAPLKSDTLQRLIDEAYTRHVPENAEESTPLSVLHGNAFARAMDDLMPNRDRGENTEVLLKLYEKLLAFPDGLECLKTSADRLREQADLPLCKTEIGAALSAAICEQLTSLQTQCQAACDVFAADEAATVLYLPAAQGDLETVERILLCLQTDNWDAARDAVLSFAPVRLRSSKKLSPSPEAMLQKERRAARVKAIRALAVYFADDADTRRAHILQTAQTEQMLYELLCDYDHAIREAKLRRGVQDFTDIRRALLTLLLDENGKPSDIALALREQYDAIYIDEYQDVDTVQDTIFATIANGTNRFMVGDIKQSIYSFRGAEPSIFADYRRRFAPISPQNLPTEQNGACLFMSDNFRCDREVINFTNAVCGYTFGICDKTLAYCRDDDLICGKDPDATRPPHPVQVVLLEKRTLDEDDDNDDEPTEDETGSTASTAAVINPEAVYIAGEIARLLKEETLDDGSPIRPRDIAVLMRSTTMADALTRALAAYGIETTHRASSSLAAHPDMTALINLLSVIDNPRDDVPLTALLTDAASPLSLQDLLLLRTAAPECAAIPLYDVLTLAATAQAPLQDIDAALSQKCAALVAFVQHWRGVAQTLPVDKLLRKLYGEPALREKASTPVYLTVYDRARHYQNTSFCGLYQFLHYFRRLLSTPGSLSSAGVADGEQDAVTILSIHKSKGLEFPVVFVADCNAAFNTKDLHAPVIFDHALGTAARIYHPDDASRRESVVRHAIAARLRVRQSEEEMRILYVALTRARERLYLTAKLRSTAAASLEHADRSTRGSRADILSAHSYISWVLAALSPANREEELSDIYRIQILDRALYTADALPHRNAVPLAAVQEAANDAALPATACKPGSAAFYRAVLREHESYDDPNTLLRTLPTKAAASKLRRDLLDSHFLPESIGEDDQAPLPPDQKQADTADYIRHRIALLRSASSLCALSDMGQKATAAERGTATHLFLQYCDHRLLADHGVKAEIQRLVQERFLTPRTASLLDRRHLQNFVQSDLFRQILSAKSVHRELQFNRFLPYRSMTERQELAARLGDASLYVQGSLDLLLEQEDGSLTLCDYKTDRLRTEDWGADIPPAERDAAIRRQLLQDHGDQLAIYADAVRGMFGKAPAHILIYSLPLGVAVDLREHLQSPALDKSPTL